MDRIGGRLRVSRKSVLFPASALIGILTAAPAAGNDSAASVGVGGIQLTREPRISMEKERLTISLQKITVEYEFLNETDRDITTEVAFPVPPYDNDYVSASNPRFLDDFRVWIDGREAKFQIDVKATVNGVDRTGVLRKLGVDVASFGHFTDNDPKHPEPYSLEIEKLIPSQREELKRTGLLGRDDGIPSWTVAKTYHWRQTFAAHKAVRVRHEYAPIFGFTPLQLEATRGKKTPAFAQVIHDSCVDAGLQNSLLAAARKEPANYGEYIETSWVDYILTTANTWKTPIRDFELVVERAAPSMIASNRWLLSFCWDGPVRQIDKDHFVARMTNFVPKRELHVAFFEMN